VGSPLFSKATVRLANGKTLVVRAHGNGPRNVYVQSLKVNGAPYLKSYLPHALLAAGAELDFEMGPAPSRWGTGPEAAPPSLTRGAAVAEPLRDATGGAAGEASASGGRDARGLFDDSSATSVTFGERTPWVQYQLRRPATVRFYTLTSAEAAGDPQAWVLKGSADGKRWTVLDQRQGESFAWRRYTRPFKVARPGPYARYRLEVTANSGEPSTSLAEVELLTAGPRPPLR
jgi:hypothetical protein